MSRKGGHEKQSRAAHPANRSRLAVLPRVMIGLSLALVLTLVLAFVLVAGCGGGDDKAQAPQGDSLAEKALDQVSEQAVESTTQNPSKNRDQSGQGPTFTAQASARSVTLTGFTRARTTLDLVAEEAGRCLEVAVDVGQAVGEDGVFARLDTTFLELDLRANQADQQRLGSDVAYYKKEAERYKALVQQDNAAQSTLDNHQRNLAVAVQQLRALKVEEERLKERIDRAIIKAPPGWLVTARDLEQGRWVTTGQQVGSVGDFTSLMVPFLLSVSERETLEEQGDLKLHLSELGVVVPAQVLRASPGFDPATRKIGVDLVIGPESAGLFEFRGGLRAELTLPLPDPGGAITVPRSAVLKAYEEYFLVRPDGVRVKVLLLGSDEWNGRDGYRVSGQEAAPGDEFLVDAQGK